MNPELAMGKLEAPDIMYNVRKFDENEELSREDGTYEDRGGFDLAIIKKCILDFGQLFQAIDQSGYSNKKPPREIMEELAEYCLEVNPQLRRFWVSGPGKVEKPDFEETRSKMAKFAKKAKIAKERDDEIRELGRKTLGNAKNTILRIFDEMSNSEIAEKLEVSEKRVKMLKSRNWTFWDCLSVAKKFDLDVEVVFGRFHESREGKETE